MRIIHPHPRRSLLSTLLATVAAFAPLGLSAAIHTVTNANSSGAGSLRQTVTNANSGDTIQFQAGMSGAIIPLGGSQIEIDKNLVIDAGSLAEKVYIDANNGSRCFEIKPGNTATLRNLYMLEGSSNGTWPWNAGGAIFNGGDLTIDDCTFFLNTAGSGGAIRNEGTLALEGCFFAVNSSTIDAGAIFNATGRTTTLVDCQLTGNSNTGTGGGGSIFNQGTLHLTDFLIDQNSATSGPGGAIVNWGPTVTIERGTFRTNSAVNGGAIANRATADIEVTDVLFQDNSATRGGAFYNPVITLTFIDLVNCTVYDNEATQHGGGLYTNGLFSLSHTTIYQNNAGIDGGGIYQFDGFLQLNNSIVAKNTAGGTGPDIRQLAGNAGGAYPSLIRNNSSVASEFPASASPLVGTSASPVEPNLGTLADNGGPTWTILPLTGSPAINGATSHINTPDTDQRGAPRTVGSKPDLGAVEVIPAGTAFQVTNNNGSGPGSLRNSVMWSSPNTTISFAGGLSGDTIQTGDTTLLIDKNLTIDASTLTNPVVIEGGTGSPSIDIDFNKDVTWKGITFDGAALTTGGFRNRGKLTLEDCLLTGHTGGYGAAVRGWGPSTLTLERTTVSGNLPSTRGVLFADHVAEIIINNSTISDNHGARGTAITSEGGPVTITNSTIANNSATEYGGAIVNQGDMTILSSTIAGNSSDGGGGGIRQEAGTLEITASIVAGNSATATGDDIERTGGSVTGNRNLTVIGSNETVETEFPASAIAGRSYQRLDPLLGPLGDYGGPTETMPPLPDSPAVDIANNNGSAIDQRGVVKPIDGNVDGVANNDAGAVELRAVMVTSAADSGPGSLRNAMADPIPQVIGFDAALAGQTILLTSGPLSATRSELKIDASRLAEGLTISGGGTSRILTHSSGKTLELDSLTIQNGFSTSNGGAISSSGNLSIYNSTFMLNSAEGNGGAISSNANGELLMENCTLSANAQVGPTSGGGGAIQVGQSSVSCILRHCTVSANSTVGTEGGGGVRNRKSLTLENTIIAGNTATSGANDLFNVGPNSTFTSVGVNLIQDTTDSGTLGISDLTGIDPMLMPLGNYDGLTWTMPPRPGSPVLGQASVLPRPANDQRGYARGGLRDVGAVELKHRYVYNPTDNDLYSLRDCLAEPYVTAISFLSSMNGETIDLLSELSIESGVIIDASALDQGVTLDAGGNSRVISVASGNNHVSLKGATITGGNSSNMNGGGIFNGIGASMTLSNLTIHDNNAGTGWGGGLFNEGAAVLTNCTVTNNRSTLGGGLYTRTGLLEVGFTTVTDNTSTGTGGGIRIFSGAMSIEGSIIAGNSGGSGPDIGNNGATVTSAGPNLIGNHASVETEFPSTDPLVGDSTTPLLPQLAPLGNYGGGALTTPPYAASPAIDAADPASANLPASDQRGFLRPAGAGPDLGAVEGQPLLLVTSAASTGPGTLRQALADSDPATRTIEIDPVLSGNTLGLSGNPLQLGVHRSLSIDASGLSAGFTIDGAAASRILEHHGDALTLVDIHLTNGLADGDGGAIASNGDLTLDRCTISKCLAVGNGGAVWTGGGTLSLINSTLAGNFAAFAGGAIADEGSSGLDIVHSTIAENEAFFGAGGGVLANGGTFSLTNSIVATNRSDTDADLSGLAPTESGTNFVSGDPRLAMLDDFGGPTPVMAPLPSSPVIEGAVVTSSTPPTDQLGNPRPSGPLPDVGAVEAVAFSSLALEDTDLDGIDDRLETAYLQLAVGVDDSGRDSDGDGQTDADELDSMTDPLDANDYFRVLDFRPVEGFDPVNPLMVVTVKTFPGLSYHFETTSTLQGFTDLPLSGFVADDFEMAFEVPLSPGRDFIRAVRD